MLKYLKKLVRMILGDDNVTKIYAYKSYLSNYDNKKIITNKKYDLFQIPNRHVFFGYYDLKQFDVKNERILVHVLDKFADPLVDDIEIGYFGLIDKKYTPLLKSRTWCWQQGARLSWVPGKEGKIIYNNLHKDKYVSEIYDIKKKRVEKRFEVALYDFDDAFTYGLSLNFSRLQRLRPGYGYARLTDSTKQYAIPEYDGIDKINFQTGEIKKLVTLKELAARMDNGNQYTHYINHISISPCGNYFIFFHIFLDKYSRWYTRLFLSDKNGENITLLEDRYKVSHYCWKDDSTVLITCYEGNRQFYETININDAKTTEINNNLLNEDGHPSFIEKNTKLITDTYPHSDCMQNLIEIDNIGYSDAVKKVIVSVFHNPLLYGEKRCDLHPRISKDERLIAIDTTALKGLRSCMVITRSN